MPGLVALLLCAAPVRGQTVEDGTLLPKGALGAGMVLTHETWDRYWEGSLKRGNENIGRLTTRSLTAMTGYGISDRLALLAMLPYVHTHASRGTLKEMHGIQDVVVAAKYGLVTVPVAGRGTLKALAVGSIAVPAGDYSPDFLPLSIGLGSRRASGRVTLAFEARREWFLNASAAYTWRSKVKLDRAAYYTGGQLHLGREVAMPDVFDYTLGGGYRGRRLHVPVSVSVQRTLGGSDIRRQDMPFVSNRMDFVRVEGGVGYTLPATNLMVRIGAARVVGGRNVGQATTLTGGFHYTLPLRTRAP
ncbi:MAG TPA: transporter [Longimicrobium sp.]